MNINKVIISGIAQELQYGVSKSGVTYCRFNLMVEDIQAGSVPVPCVVLKDCATTLNKAGEGSDVLFIGQVSVKIKTTETGKTYYNQSVSGFELIVIKPANAQTSEPLPLDSEIDLDSIPF